MKIQYRHQIAMISINNQKQVDLYNRPDAYLHLQRNRHNIRRPLYYIYLKNKSDTQQELVKIVSLLKRFV